MSVSRREMLSDEYKLSDEPHYEINGFKALKPTQIESAEPTPEINEDRKIQIYDL